MPPGLRRPDGRRWGDPMAGHVYRLAAGQDGNFGALAESDQTAASRADGWTVGTTAAGVSAEFDAGTKQAASTFTSQSTNPKPAAFNTGTTANAFKTPTALNGVFANADWTLTFAVRSTGGTAQRGRIRLRVFKSANADGSAATELTTATQQGATIASMSTSADNTSVVTWTPGSIVTLNNEYLFFVIAWSITTAGGAAGNDVILRTGQAASGSQIVTPNFARMVAAAQITGQSSVGGNAAVQKHLQFAAVVSGSSVTSVVVTRRAIITSSVVSAASVVGAIVVARRLMTHAVISGECVMGMVPLIRPIDPQINGQSNLFGTVTKPSWRLVQSGTTANAQASDPNTGLMNLSKATTVGNHIARLINPHDNSGTFVPVGGGTWQLIGSQLDVFR